VVLVQPQSPYQPAGYAANREPLTTGAFMGMFILQAIPLLGFILLLVWAFGSDVNINKRSFARAALILGLILGALSLLGFIVMVLLAGGVAALNN